MIVKQMMICEICHNAAVQYRIILDGVPREHICGGCRYGGAIIPERATFIWVSACGTPRQHDGTLV
jgi:hypothetical protein